MRIRRDIGHIPLRRGRGAHVRPRVIGADDAPQPERPVDRHRRAGGPNDRALYSCSCGYQFDAPVSASVHCPQCGQGQAW